MDLNDKNTDYNAKSISVLEGLEAVRKRPGMYVGDTTKAVLQMVSEVIDNCIDEHSMGFCDSIYFNFKNGIFAIRDNGRGIPVDMHESGKPAVEVILTTLHSGGKFDNNSYKYSGGLHGVGVSVVNALSKWFEVEVYRNNTIYFMRFENSLPATKLEERGYTDWIGTKITFCPDLELIDSEMPSSTEIKKRLQELSYLNSSLKINYEFEDEKLEFFSSGGIKDLAVKLGKPILDDICYFKSETVEVAFMWTDADDTSVLCFTNNIAQIDGGTHLTGFNNALSKIIIPYVEEEISTGKTKIKKVVSDDVKMGLKGVVSIKIIEPRFSSQTKNKLVSAEARPLVESFVTSVLSEFLEKNPREREKIVKRVIVSANMREAMNQSKELVKKTNMDDFYLKLPGKLADCRAKPEDAEIFIVEGDSAGGSAKTGRNREFQAILSLRGKPLNVERAHLNKALSCDSVTSIIAALGTGVGQHFDINKLKYHKVIIMTDADVDGLHIRCLLITLFLKLIPEIVERNHVYISRTPLYKVSYGKASKYIQDEEEMEHFLFQRFCDNHKIIACDMELNIEEVKKLVNLCNDFRSFIQKKSIILDPKILSLALVYDIFKTPDVFLRYINNIIDGEISLDKRDDEVILNINSLYGKSSYNIKNYNVDWSIDKFPLIVDEEKIYDPIDFLKVFQKKSTSGISIQRYKGLGEMNADELAETSLEPAKRRLESLVINGSMEETMMHMKTIMGNENDRRDFVLGHIKEVFGIYLDH